MRRKSTPQTTISHERWLISYADFVTLLFAFFVVMYSVSQVNEGKYKALASTLGAAFDPTKKHDATSDTAHSRRDPSSYSTLSRAPSNSSLDSVIVSESGLPEPPAIPESLAMKTLPMKRLQKKLIDNLSQGIDQGRVMITGTDDWTDIVLDTELMFSSGRAHIELPAKQTFTQVAQILAAYDNAIAVAGHTDNVPINNKEYSNNWSLSAARAVSVVRFFEKEGIASQRLSAIGYGEQRPMVKNTTDENRRKNRRVVLRVSNQSTFAMIQSDEGVVLTSALSPDKKPSQPQQFDVINGDNLSQNKENADIDRERRDLKAPFNNIITPVILNDGGLLFSSDPDLPRFNYNGAKQKDVLIQKPVRSSPLDATPAP